MHDNTKSMSATTAEMSKTTSGMSATTNDMSKTTSGMAKTTSDMAVTTNGMAKTVGFTYTDLRIGNTRQARADALDSMNRSHEQATKLGYASEYFAAQEYQFWKPSAESKEARLELMAVSVKDFFRKVHEYISDRDQVDPTKTDNDSKNLFAIVGALHYVNFAQSDALAGTHESIVTMLSMIEDGLRAKADVDSGKIKTENLPAYQLEVLREEQDAIYLLRVRQNFLKGFGFVLASAQPNGDDPAKSKEIWDAFKAKVFKGKWDPNFEFRNATQVEYNAIVFEYALETEQFLTDIKVDPKANKLLTVFLKSMNLDSMSAADQSPKAKSVNRLKTAMTQILTLDSLKY